MTNLLGDARIGMLQQALSGLARRQQAVAGNIANVDTPGYQRRDVPFEAQLRGAIGGSGARLAGTAAGHLTMSPATGGLLSSGAGRSPERTASPRNDDNNVDIDYEMTQLVETNLRYQLLTQATSTRFTTLRDIVMRIS